MGVVYNMNIIAQSENRICVELTRDDMIDLDITYDELDYSNTETRRVLWTILDEAQQRLGTDISLSQKLMIEALPDKQGGCMLFFTVMDKTQKQSQQKKLIKQQQNQLICKSNNIENICSLSKILKNTECITNSELYKKDEIYTLIFWYDTISSKDFTFHIYEFGTLVDICTIPVIQEHWQKIIPEKAVEKLSLYS